MVIHPAAFESKKPHGGARGKPTSPNFIAILQIVVQIFCFYEFIFYGHMQIETMRHEQTSLFLRGHKPKTWSTTSLHNSSKFEECDSLFLYLKGEFWMHFHQIRRGRDRV